MRRHIINEVTTVLVLVHWCLGLGLCLGPRYNPSSQPRRVGRLYLDPVGG